MELNLSDVILEGETSPFEVVKTEERRDGVLYLKFSFSAEKPAELKPVKIWFKFPSIDISGFWNPALAVDKVNYYSSGIKSKISSNAALLTFIGNKQNNRITISLSDAMNESEITCYLKEEDVCFYPTIKLFSEKMPQTTSYNITLRIDTRDIPYYKALDDAASWWAAMPQHKPMLVPEAARRPMYSTWYSYHQNISAEDIMAECNIAKSLGCEAVIVDDGWQTMDGNRGYAYTGDWQPERIPDMKSFVAAVHKLGMKIILWYSLPFIGEKSQIFPKFEGKYLRHWKEQRTYVLDPRYPEVREHIVNTYVKAVQEWELDGFKLDFVGWFKAAEHTKLTCEDGRDYASVNEATNALMIQISSKLSHLNPTILIEFRQPYIGPLMRRYGNMFRGCDVPNNAVANRLEITNLRLISQNTAVHSDMFIWRKEETPQQAALQILNIIFSVPQLSVKLAEIPNNHLQMIRFWFEYWNRNRDVILDGTFQPSSPISNYPSLTSVKDKHQITAVYEDVIVVSDKEITRLDLINAKASQIVVFRLENPFQGKLIIKNCLGKLQEEKSITLKKEINALEVPQSGLAQLQGRYNCLEEI